MALTKGFVSLDGVEGKFECYLEDSKWNGFAKPWFTEEVADEICKVINSDLAVPLKIAKANCSEHPIYCQYDFEELPDAPYEYDGQDQTIGDEVLVLIPLGTAVWCWEVA